MDVAGRSSSTGGRSAAPSSRFDATSCRRSRATAYYVADLVGLDVFDERGVRVGRVRDVLPGPANDALELDTGLLLPLVEDCIREVDLAGRCVLLNPGFTD